MDLETQKKRVTQQGQFQTWYMLSLVNEMQGELNENNCTGASEFLFNGDIFVTNPFGFNEVYSRTDFKNACLLNKETRITSNYGIGDVAAEEVFGFLVYQFDGAGVDFVGGRYVPYQYRGIGIAGFTGFYDISFLASFYEAGQQDNFTKVSTFIRTNLVQLGNGDCDRWAAGFSRNATFESDYNINLNTRDNIRTNCSSFIDSFRSVSVSIEEIYVSGSGAMAYWHFMGVRKSDGETFISNTFSYFEINSATRIDYLYNINDIYTGNGTII